MTEVFDEEDLINALEAVQEEWEEKTRLYGGIGKRADLDGFSVDVVAGEKCLVAVYTESYSYGDYEVNRVEMPWHIAILSIDQLKLHLHNMQLEAEKRYQEELAERKRQEEEDRRLAAIKAEKDERRLYRRLKKKYGGEQ